MKLNYFYFVTSFMCNSILNSFHWIHMYIFYFVQFISLNQKLIFLYLRLLMLKLQLSSVRSLPPAKHHVESKEKVTLQVNSILALFVKRCIDVSSESIGLLVNSALMLNRQKYTRKFLLRTSLLQLLLRFFLVFAGI